MLDGIIWSTAEARDQLSSPMSTPSVSPEIIRTVRASAKPIMRAKAIATRDEAIEAMKNFRGEEWRSDTMKESVMFFNSEKSVIGAPIMSMALVNSFWKGATHSFNTKAYPASSSVNVNTKLTIKAATMAMTFGIMKARAL